MGRLRYGSGIATVELDDTMDRIDRRAVEVVHPGLVAAIEAKLEKVGQALVTRWPVRTGKSAAGFDWYVRVSQIEIKGVVENKVPYTYYVRPRALWGGTTGWSEWVQIPMRQAQQELVDELGPEIVRGLAHG